MTDATRSNITRVETSPNVDLKLGVIGMSDGNGHPYSWSAIINGFDQKYMQDCPFPVIPAYLNEQQWPQSRLGNAHVTHIWTQDRVLSEHIARASNIPNIVDSFEDMLGNVDGILLARDDAKSHLHFAKPFLEAGLPIYIDKPLALSVAEAEVLYSTQKYNGQIFSCSALRYAPELRLTAAQKAEIGKIIRIDAVTPKYWDTYAVHIIEPSLHIIGFDDTIDSYRRSTDEQHQTLHIQWNTGLYTTFTCTGNSPANISIAVTGEKTVVTLNFKDTFYCFKKSLFNFLRAAKNRKNTIPEHQTLRVVEIIEYGRS